MLVEILLLNMLKQQNSYSIQPSTRHCVATAYSDPQSDYMWSFVLDGTNPRPVSRQIRNQHFENLSSKVALVHISNVIFGFSVKSYIQMNTNKLRIGSVVLKIADF